ncbi:hypothetical protein D9615_000874 [Tricholomella constricta]|uniref:Uncharacterized protein n=1 Tax=Tricholomella constricta TaxID=117010 RepID=A0A8H5M8W5_9AGAR|nr:hypothetical protein D9615_000874 [Tricholomella constricta]
MVIFDPTSLPNIVDATSEWYARAGANEGMFQILNVSPQNPLIVLCLFYNGSEAEGRVNYKCFFDIGPIADMTREMPYEELNAVQNGFAYPGQGAYMKGSAHRKPVVPAITKAHQRIVDVFKASGLKANLIFEYLPLSNITSIPADAAAFRRDPTAKVLALIQWQENTPENTALARATASEVLNIVTSAEPDLGAPEKLGYSNYDFDAVQACIMASTRHADDGLSLTAIRPTDKHE